MSKVVSYKEIMAFHPGYYISDMIEEMEITQEEFAIRLGTTAKTISKLVNGSCNVTQDLACKLSMMLGTSIEFWLNLQKKYDEKVAEIDQKKSIDEQEPILDMIDYPYFVNNFGLPNVKNTLEKIKNLCAFLKVASLNVFNNRDFLVNFRTGVSDITQKNIVNSRVWVQAAMNIATEMQTQVFDAEKLSSYLPEIRSMTVKEPKEFAPRLKEIFNDCGIAFVVLPTLKNSGINGAVRWINKHKVMLAMNNRKLSTDIFWFSLFHEIKHLMQHKSADSYSFENGFDKEEDDADRFAQNHLIPLVDYLKLNPSKYIKDEEIIRFANQIGVHPGIVAGRLEHDKIIHANRSAKFKEKIDIESFM